MKEIIGVLLFLAIIYFTFNWYKDRNYWTLIVCKSQMNGVECYDNLYEIPGFKSAKECLLEGASRFAKEGFECVSGCKNKDGLNVCNKICNASGCDDPFANL